MEKECEDANDFINRMEFIDNMVAQQLNHLHSQQMEAINKRRKAKQDFKVGDKVWVLKPPTKDVNAKLEPRWKGPLTIQQRQGHYSYVAKDKRGNIQQVHLDQLKAYVEDNDDEE